MAIPGNPVQFLSPLQQQMASLPEIPRVPTNDGVLPGSTIAGNKLALVPDDPEAEQAPTRPTLQDADPATKYQTIEQLVRSQDRLARNRWAIDTHFNRLRAGVPFSRLDKIPNQSIWVAKLPSGMNKETTAAVPNKADDLCNKIEDTLMADPAKPIATPHIEDEAAMRAADMLSEFLAQITGESGIHDIANHRWAIRNALSGASSFLHYLPNPSGGGYQPMQKLAHPQATDPNDPLKAQIPQPDGSVMLDITSNPILRYAGGNQFVDAAEQADRVWLPGITVERLKRESVRVYPPTATVETAKAVVLIRHMTLQEAMHEFPDTVGQMDDTKLQSLASWRPPSSEYITPYAMKGAIADGMSGPSVEQVGSLSPQLQRRMFCYHLYVAASPEYPEGYWCVVASAENGQVLAEGTLDYTVTLPVHGKTKRCRDIPVEQYTPQPDVLGGDPMGWPVISRFAGSSEAESTLYAAFMDYCDNMLHPHVFLRGTASIDEDDWFDRLKPIILNPGDQEPSYEHFPTIPPILQIIENLDTKMDTISGLTATAQGLDTSSAVSGVAKNLTIRQAQVSMSAFLQYLHAAMTRGWRICGQIAMATFETPQLMQFSGEEGSVDPIWWTGEDLAGVDRIGVQPGTGTMQTPESKAQYIAYLQQNMWMTPETAASVALPSIRMDLGIPKDPYEAAIERSVGLFLQGPPDPQWVQRKQQDQQVMAQYQQAIQPLQIQASAGVQVQIPPAPQPTAASPFPTRPNDTEPQVAEIYRKRLSKLFVDPKFSAQPPEWQGTAVEAYQRFVQTIQQAQVQQAQVKIIGQAKDAKTLQEEEKVSSGGGQPQPQGSHPGSQGTPPPKPPGT